MEYNVVREAWDVVNGALMDTAEKRRHAGRMSSAVTVLCWFLDDTPPVDLSGSILSEDSPTSTDTSAGAIVVKAAVRYRHESREVHVFWTLLGSEQMREFCVAREELNRVHRDTHEAVKHLLWREVRAQYPESTITGTISFENF